MIAHARKISIKLRKLLKKNYIIILTYLFNKFSRIYVLFIAKIMRYLLNKI